jgi:heme-degrading monooxygenase HmoA
MFSVIFEVKRKPDRQDEYIQLAMGLNPILRTIDGFIENERFESETRPGWLLSHSAWRDEKSLVRWRTQGDHHAVQEKGRFDIFEDYHLRVGEIVNDTSPPSGVAVIEQRFDESQIGEATYATFTEAIPRGNASFAAPTGPADFGLALDTDGLLDHGIYRSISAIYPDARPYQPGKLALLLSWKTAAAAKAWVPRPPAGASALRHRVTRVVRDYGMFDRREAPQYYEDVKGTRETLHPAPAR